MYLFSIYQNLFKYSPVYALKRMLEKENKNFKSN